MRLAWEEHHKLAESKLVEWLQESYKAVDNALGWAQVYTDTPDGLMDELGGMRIRLRGVLRRYEVDVEQEEDELSAGPALRGRLVELTDIDLPESSND